MRTLREGHSEILTVIRDEKQLSDEIDQKLNGVVDSFTKAFA